jgi:hypothetical protein
MGDVKTSTGSAATEGDSLLQQGNAAFAAGDYEAAGACVRVFVLVP